MSENALLYALSTIAQCAAALAALIGFFGLWRQDRLRERMNIADRVIDGLRSDRADLVYRHFAPGSRDRRYFEQLSSLEQRLQEANKHLTAVQIEQQQLMDVLVRFLIGTLALLAVAIVLLAFADRLHTWPWLMRGFILVASLWLGAAPAYVVLDAAGHARAVRHYWSRLRYQRRYLWGRVRTWRGPTHMGNQLWSQWDRARPWVWDSPQQYWRQRGWPTLHRWGTQARTRVKRLRASNPKPPSQKDTP